MIDEIISRIIAHSGNVAGFKKTGWNNRNLLALWISNDGMKTWNKKLTLAKVQKESGAICYPHALPDDKTKTLLVACEDAHHHYLLRIPYDDLLK